MLILASTSATRQTLLRRAGLSFTVVSPGVDEAVLKQDFTGPPEALARALAAAKAAAVSAQHPGALVLGADQVLVCEDRLFDKPDSPEDAAAHLRALAGRAHQLITAASLTRDGTEVWTGVQTATLHMRPLSEAFIADYLAREGDAVCASVGAYRLEELGAQLFTAIEGDVFTILGLPLLPMLGYLRACGVLAA